MHRLVTKSGGVKSIHRRILHYWLVLAQKDLNRWTMSTQKRIYNLHIYTQKTHEFLAMKRRQKHKFSTQFDEFFVATGIPLAVGETM